MNNKRFLRFVYLSFISIFALSACSKDAVIDNRESDYGFVQFKLYKEASYEGTTRAIVSQLDYLYKASKITVNMDFDGASIVQTLPLTAADNESAEYGLRSNKLKLLTGSYRVVSFTLYDALDEPLYIGTNTSTGYLEVVSGGLTTYDLTANVLPRGKVRFSLFKDGIDKTPAALTRAQKNEYTFDEISRADITVQNKANNRSYTFEGLPMKFSVHFDRNNDKDGTFGYTTSSSQCDSLFSLPASDYRITSYTLYNSSRSVLESRISTTESPIAGDFTVEDNRTTDVNVGVTINLTDQYIADYIALKEIWEALDGPNWYYAGENFNKGCNWNFNKDIDLWGDQPGVQLHSNGRVARIDLSDFGVRGAIPESLGQLDQLVELYLGTHNDTNLYEYDPTADLKQSISQRSTNRIKNNKEYLAMRHPAPPMSEPCARALREHGIIIPETALYEQGYTESQLIDPKTGLQNTIHLFDLTPGKLCNGITYIPESIGKLTKLEYLYIANGEIKTLPQSIANLESLTDLEIYNCPKMSKFPVQIAQMPELISVNLSNNRQWTAEEVYAGLDALAQGASHDKIQILYCTDNNLEEIPESFSNLTKIGLLDLDNNKISVLHPLGSAVAPVQIYLDNNRITELPVDAQGYFCQMNDMETFSAPNNRLTKFPNIFRTNGYTISTINLSNNSISEFPSREEFAGIRVQTLTLNNNPIGKFPSVLINNDKDSAISYIEMRACQLDGFEKNSFVGKNSSVLMSLDLSYNRLTEFPEDFRATNMPYLYGIDISSNAFSKFPYEPFDAYTLTVYAVRSQRDNNGRRCLSEWPTGVYQHTGLRGLYLGSNDLRRVNDRISYLIYMLDISDNPNITFDASDICLYWQAGLYTLIYDKTQNIINCEAMLQ